MSSSADRSAGRAFESARVGDVIAGLRLERLLGRGRTGAVYEAAQLSLGRTVALRLIDPAYCPSRDARLRVDRELGLASSLHHPGLVPLFEAGEWAGGRFVVMRLIQGPSLGSRLEAGALSGARAAEMLEPVAAGLEAAHGAGLSHGAVRAANVLVDRDGRTYLADLGLGRGEGAEADRERLAAMRRALGPSPAVRRPRKALAAAAIGIAGAMVAAALLLSGGSGEDRAYAEEPAPPAPEGTEPLGSRLPPGPAEAVGCGRRFAGASSCTVALAGVDGVALRATEPGVIRSWAVRAATGELTLQVLRPGGARTRLAGFSQPVEAPDAGSHRFTAEVGVDRGELIAVKLGSGAELGRREGGGGAFRWAGAGLPLPGLAQATPLNGELLVRVDLEPGAEPSAPPQVFGRQADTAPDGTTLAETVVAVSTHRAVEVRLVIAGGRIYVDAFSASRRTARLALGDVDAEGELLLFGQGCGAPRSVCMRWRNPGEAAPLVHEFRVDPRGRFRLIG